MLFVGRRRTIEMGHVDGVDDGVGYGVSGESNAIEGTGVYGSSSKSGIGLIGIANRGTGVYGESQSGHGVVGLSTTSGHGVVGESDSGDGMHGTSGSLSGVYGESNSGAGVYGNSKSGFGMYGYSPNGHGVVGQSDSGDGMHGTSGSLSGVYGESNSGAGVYGNSKSGDGVYGYSDSSYGVHGWSNGQTGVVGISNRYAGVVGESRSLTGVIGYGPSIGVDGYSSSGGNGVRGYSSSGIGVAGYSDSSYALYGRSRTGSAAYLDGNVRITGYLQKAGGGFKIDHPLDPANKYLYHSFVESPDMKNVYDGVVALDDKGEAEIDLPDWFSGLNKDFRYQLTAIGAPGPNLYIAEEISDSTTTMHASHHDNDDDSSDNNNSGNRFKIAGGTSGMKVSWQVTGIRKDPWANAHRVQIEEDKPEKERGYYIYPDLYGQPEENGISRLLFPEKEKQELLINGNKPNL
jgi:hypothetical protein